jgi:hypothetical protein
MTMPSPKEYLELFAELRECKTAFDTAADDDVRLTHSRRQLQAVLHFLWCDLDVVNAELTAPLAALRTATYDLAQGANVALLEKRPPLQPGKPPNNTSREVVQGCLAFCLELLTVSKMGTEQAANWIASEARNRVQTPDGSPVTAQQIITWRSEIRREKAPIYARFAFDRMRNKQAIAAVLKGPHTPIKRKPCLKIAADLITSIANVAPQSAPKQTMRART